MSGVDPDYDVVICGGGLAGLTLARQLRREIPQWRVAILERTRRPLPEGCHKVGESSVELGSQYLERLGLRDYLLEKHLVKFGLRFYPGGGHLPLHERAELGPAQEPIVRSYQIDRGRFEEDLRGMNEAEGVVLLEGAMVREIDVGPGEAPHCVAFERDGEKHELTARWVVDATGRTALLKRRLKLARGSGHTANAGWFRVAGRVEPADLVPASATAWHEQPFAPHRWRSTNHFMGPGYWVWFIPLSSGMTSVGVVVHDELHGFDRVRTLERAMAFIEEHEPYVAERLRKAEVLDFRCLKDYSHAVARSWSSDRWALVGEAGAFVDPLYSPGTDFIGFANTFTVELMRDDLAGDPELEERVRQLNLQYRALVSGAVDVFRSSAPVYGHARGMAYKIFWDNFAYWSFPCQYFQQKLYRVRGDRHATLTRVGGRFVELSGYVQRLLAAWVKLDERPAPAGFLGLPAFPSLLVETHLDLQKEMTPDQALAYMETRAAQGDQMVAEFVIRLLLELGPRAGAQLLEQAGVAQWDLAFEADRLDAEQLTGVARRNAVGEIAKDVDRNFGRVERHPEGMAALSLLHPLIRGARSPASSVARPAV